MYWGLYVISKSPWVPVLPSALTTILAPLTADSIIKKLPLLEADPIGAAAIVIAWLDVLVANECSSSIDAVIP